MGSGRSRAAKLSAVMRQTGIQAPPAVLMPAGVIRLTADADCLFDWTPLPQHDKWLQGRLTRAEWSDLILLINDASLFHPCDPRYGRHFHVGGELRRDLHMSGGRMAVFRVREEWLARGVDLLMQVGTPARLYLKPVPLGSSPSNNAAGLGERGGLAHMLSGHANAAPTGTASTADGTWASPPPAYPADNVSGPRPSAPAAAAAAASVHAFPLVVKPAPAHSTDEGQPAGSFQLKLAAFRFCPLCAAPVEAHNTGKTFCGECGGQWW